MERSTNEDLSGSSLHLYSTNRPPGYGNSREQTINVAGSFEDLPGNSMDVDNTAAEDVLKMLPPKSREIYECSYNRFLKWCKENHVKSYSESVLLIYFTHLSATMKCSTLWSHYSMVRATLKLKDGVDLEKFLNLRAFLKRQNNGYKPKRSRVFTRRQIDQFLNCAPENKYLMMKVVLILGVLGACRCDELVRLKLDDIEDVKSALLVKIVKSKTNNSRSFMVRKQSHLNIYRKYVALRPKNFEEQRLFIKYQRGKCYRNVVGIHKIGSIVQDVANFLNLENPSEYTGHCLRRTSAMLRLDTFGDFTLENNTTEECMEEFTPSNDNIHGKISRYGKPNTSDMPI